MLYSWELNLNPSTCDAFACPLLSHIQWSGPEPGEWVNLREVLYARSKIEKHQFSQTRRTSPMSGACIPPYVLHLLMRLVDAFKMGCPTKISAFDGYIECMALTWANPFIHKLECPQLGDWGRERPYTRVAQCPAIPAPRTLSYARDPPRHLSI